MTYTDQELQARIDARRGSTRRWELLLTVPESARAAIAQEAHFVMNHVGGRFSDAIADAIRAYNRGDAFTSPLAESLYVEASAARLRGPRVHDCKFCGIAAPKSRFDAVTFWPAARGYSHSSCWAADVDRRRTTEAARRQDPVLKARQPWEDLSAGVVTMDEAVALVLENDQAAAQRRRSVTTRVIQGGYDSLKGGASDGLANYCPDGI